MKFDLIFTAAIYSIQLFPCQWAGKNKKGKKPVNATPMNMMIRPPQSTTRLPSALHAPCVEKIKEFENKSNHLQRVHV